MSVNWLNPDMDWEMNVNVDGKHSDKIFTDHCTFLLGPQPKATLLFSTPEWVVAQATKGYTGHYSSEPLTEQEVQTFWQELGATKLKGPLEMAQTFWLVEDVTRAFTHQLARYRMGMSMVQESQRFSVQEGIRAKIMIPQNVTRSGELEAFIESCEQAMIGYHTAILAGIPVQDARAYLPQHICTRLYVNFTMSSLAHVYDQRSCCQAQEGEWEILIQQFKQELWDKGFIHYHDTLMAPWENPTCTSCGFGAAFDRPCSHKAKFDRNLENLYWKDK